MAYDMTTPKASPKKFKAPRKVKFSFTASGSGTLKLVYSASTLTLDGQKQATGRHELTADEKPYSDTFLVNGDPGNRNVRIKASQGNTSDDFVVVLDLQE
jgi:hypothetical protein